MRQGSSARRINHLQVVGAPVVVARDKALETWPVWASLLLVLGAAFASWTAIILTAQTLAG